MFLDVIDVIDMIVLIDVIDLTLLLIDTLLPTQTATHWTLLLG